MITTHSLRKLTVPRTPGAGDVRLKIHIFMVLMRFLSSYRVPRNWNFWGWAIFRVLGQFRPSFGLGDIRNGWVDLSGHMLRTAPCNYNTIQCVEWQGTWPSSLVREAEKGVEEEGGKTLKTTNRGNMGKGC
jgi:hypothetical protein